ASSLGGMISRVVGRPCPVQTLQRSEAMVINLPPQLEAAISEEAERRGVSPEVLALEALRERFLPAAVLQPRDEWKRRWREGATDCGVSLSNEALSSEGLYD